MRMIKVAAAALNQTPLDWAGNFQNITAAIDEARRQEASVVCLPELAITGYGCEDAFFSPAVQEQAIKSLQRLISLTEEIIVAVGLPIQVAGALYNCVAVVADKKLIGFAAKSHLAGDGIHYEPRWFKPWPTGKTGNVCWSGTDFPIGNLIFDFEGVRIGFEICEDAWTADRPGRMLANKAVDIILNPSASHFSLSKQAERRRLVQESSRALGGTYVYSNLLGNESGRVIYDGATLIASGGEWVAEGPRLTMEDFEVLVGCVDLDTTRMIRIRKASSQPEICDKESGVVHVPFELAQVEYQLNDSRLADWEKSQDLKEEEFSRAVALGLFDYLRKSRSDGFVVSLSGGADSSAVVVLVWLAVKLGMQQLGVPRLIAKLAHINNLNQSKIGQANSAERLVENLLTTVYQSTANSSRQTKDLAAKLASAVGAEHVELDVEPMVASYLSEVTRKLGRALSWEQDDIALQNIQARARAPSAWLLANLKNALLLATSNRSEAAVGYATMDGDTCGGLLPIGGIDKAFLLQWLRWMSRTGPMGVGPVPVLHAIVQQKPTAELRPREAKQTDEEDLMPYEVLDWIERAAIRDKLGPAEILTKMRIEFPERPESQRLAWVERFFQLWVRNQWKRERYAPSFHLDDENLDPKTWCRFPILSGGYANELAETSTHESGVQQSLFTNQNRFYFPG